MIRFYGVSKSYTDDVTALHDVSLEMLQQFHRLVPRRRFAHPTRVMGLDFPNPVGLAAGLAVFVGLGVAGILAGGTFLDDRELGVGTVTLILECAATVSIGLVLLEMFSSVLGGSRPIGTASPILDDRR